MNIGKLHDAGKLHGKIARCKKIAQRMQSCINNLYSTLKTIQLYMKCEKIEYEDNISPFLP